MTDEILSVISDQVFGVWFLIGAALVFWMQAGFAMVEAGFTRAKNTGNIIMKNLMDFCIGTVVFILLGFGLFLGDDIGGIIGKPNFAIFTDYANFDWSGFVLCDDSDHRFRSNGRENEVPFLLYLLCSNFRSDLSN